MNDPLFFVAAPSELGELAGVAGDVLQSTNAVRRAYFARRSARWILGDTDALLLFADAVPPHDTWHRVLFLQPAQIGRRELLHALFRVVIAPEDGVSLLPIVELTEVMADARAADLLIGGVVDLDDRRIVFYRGNLDRLVVPFEWFRTTCNGSRPDFNAFSVVDCGQTVKLGDYEASVDAMLYEFDPNARRRMRQREIGADATFGGSLRRLRLHKGLRRSDFAPISAKSIARIERGEVAAPRGATVAIIAKRLGVQRNQIESY